MILLNGKKFVNGKKSIIDSLFISGGTASGYYRKFKKQIALYNLKDEKIGVITSNRVLTKATKQGKKFWYSYGTIKEIGEYLSYSDEVSDIENALKLL